MSSVRTLVSRAVRQVVPARSKERYFSDIMWNNTWCQGYGMSMNRAQEDARYGTLIALMRRHEGKGPILDVGCGDGLLEERYRQVSSKRMVGFDYSAAAIELARARQLPDVEFLCSDGRTFFTIQRFSLVVLNESLYYVDEYLDLLERLSRALTPDGVFVISMHNARITKRIWKNVQRYFMTLDSIIVKHENSQSGWHIRLMRPNR